MLQKARMRISAMKTAEAMRQVSDSLVTIQGVGDIGVDGEEGLLEVAYDPEKTSLSGIHSALDSAGFAAQELP